MRSSADFFNQDPNSFETLKAPFVPRPTVPFFVKKVALKPLAPLPPKINYPVVTKRPIQPQTTALEQIQLQIQKEVSDLHKNKPNLDQLIQNALKQKIQHDHQTANQKIITLKKNSPTTPPNPYIPASKPIRNFWWPTNQPSEDKPLKTTLPKAEIVSSIPLAPTPPTKAPVPTQVEGPNIKDVPLIDKNDFPSSSMLLESFKDTFSKPKRTKPLKPVITPAPPILTNTNIKILSTKNTPSSTNVTQNAFHISYNFLNYFLFTISSESDPYNDFHRQLIIYSLKAGAYLASLGGVFELMRNLKIGLSLNGQLEVITIFLISAILFFFGENLTVLFKPTNPYQIHEVV